MTTDLPVPGTALAVAAHPDDAEFGCGATLAKWAAAGCRIVHVVCTDGARGTWDPGRDPAQLVATREQEQRAAAKALGGSGEVVFLRWPDGELEAGVRQRFQLAGAIRRHRPDVVLGHDPWRRYRLHPDHRNAGFLVTDAIVAARDPLYLPELAGAPHRPATLLLFEAEEPDHAEDAEGWLGTKLEALLCHESQHESTMAIVGGADRGAVERQQDEFTQRVRQEAARQGAPFGLGAAEAFKRIDDL